MAFNIFVSLNASLLQIWKKVKLYRCF